MRGLCWRACGSHSSGGFDRDADRESLELVLAWRVRLEIERDPRVFLRLRKSIARCGECGPLERWNTVFTRQHLGERRLVGHAS